MESENHKIIKNFISIHERKEIIDWVKSIQFNQSIDNHHIEEVRKSLNGNSYMFDISKTKQTEYICNFQSGGNVIDQELPKFIINLSNRISKLLKIPHKNVFLQTIDTNSGGKVSPHYDSSLNGFINYKCNISVLSENSDFFVGNEIMNIDEGDLYCFEASLYKHWSNSFNFDRIILSFGFILEYSDLGRDENDPRVRLSKRIERYFQSL
jgi:hypothetical protein